MALDAEDLLLERRDLLQHLNERRPQALRDVRARLCERQADLAFASESEGIMMPNSRRIPRQRGEVALPVLSHWLRRSVQRLQRLLLEALDRYLTNLRAACGFRSRRPRRLDGHAATDVRLHVMRGRSRTV